MHERGLCCHAVAGCLSVTFAYRDETAKDTAILTVECEQETVPRLSYGTLSDIAKFFIIIIIIYLFSISNISSGFSATAELLVYLFTRR